MLTFLFWNLKGKDLSVPLSRLAGNLGVDIMLLAECTVPADTVCTKLNASNQGTLFIHAPDNVIGARRSPSGVEIFSRLENVLFTSESGDTRYTIRYLELPDRANLIIAAVHLRSAYLDGDMMARELGIRQFVKELRRVENHKGIDQTLVVGDLNVNPFDQIAVTADGLHAVASRMVARRGGRWIGSGESKTFYPFFYNPTWRFLGDDGDGPSGTFFRDKNDVLSYFWHMYDQVLLRPSLLDFWDDDSFFILTGDGEDSFLRNGEPDSRRFSDHLPILFRLQV